MRIDENWLDAALFMTDNLTINKTTARRTGRGAKKQANGEKKK
jgi:hypothetical protein